MGQWAQQTAKNLVGFYYARFRSIAMGKLDDVKTLKTFMNFTVKRLIVAIVMICYDFTDVLILKRVINPKAL